MKIHCWILTKLEFSRHIFEKYSNIKLNENPLLDLNETWIFSTYFRKILKYQTSWKSVQWQPSCSTRMYGQTWPSKQSLFAILQTPLKSGSVFVSYLPPFSFLIPVVHVIMAPVRIPTCYKYLGS